MREFLAKLVWVNILTLVLAIAAVVVVVFGSVEVAVVLLALGLANHVFLGGRR